jgi:Flp pilus assembly protein TadG
LGLRPMWKRTRKTLQKLCANRLAIDTSGAEIAEAAAVLPLMFMILLGIFWFGQAFRLYGTITRAAQDGARAGAVSSCTTCTAGTSNVTNAVNAVNSDLLASNLNPNAVQGPTGVPPINACPNVVNGNSCQTSGSSQVCVQPSVQLSSTSVAPSGATGVCGIAVTFQYPYSFWLPFTSLNKQQIMLTATARVRIENQ